ncbi:MAG TPA: hypothetical protein VKB89_04110 [Xanthobacteraceae bacterium]|nr:hypothetical protein [Xanthobacteraceae bacterium]
MLLVVRYVFVALVVLLPARALAGPAEEASAVIDRWAAALNANDADAVVKLYAPDGLLHGTSSPTLNAGTSWSPSVTPPRWASDSTNSSQPKARRGRRASHSS